jgi:tetratricopeptide (TPR) repeat protein
MNSENYQGINIIGGKNTFNDTEVNFVIESPKQNPPNNILYSGSANFVGREYELSQLSEKLQKPNELVFSAVSGMGGVGKTELAVRYARQHEADYPGGICWLNARDSNLAAEIVQFAQFQMGLEVPHEVGGRPLNHIEQVKWCWQKWQPLSGLVLVILDDVTDLRSCQELLPKFNRFHILITTRLLRLDTNFTDISLGVLSPEKALKLVSGVLGHEDRRVQREPQAAQELCQWLGFLPLGLELVSRYLVEDPDLSLEKLLQLLKAQKLEQEGINPPEEQLQATEMTAKRGVLAAFELSWKELNPMTQRVGQLLSLFALDVIPWKLVEVVTQHLSWANVEVDSAKKHFYKRHFIQRLVEKENCYKIHPLIREFLQTKLTESQEQNELKQFFTKAFAEITQTIPESPTRNLIESIKDVIPHLVEIARNLNSALSNEDLSLIFVGLTRFYESQGFYKDAQKWCEHRLSISKQRLGEEHTDIADCYNSLSLVCYSQGSCKEAEQYSKEALRIRQKLLDENHLDLSQSLHNLGTIFYYNNSYFEAESLFKQALRIRIKHFTWKGNFSLINLDYLQSFLDEGINSADLNVQSSFILETFNFKSLFLNRRCSIIDYFLSSFDSDSNNQDNLILYLAESLNNLAAINRFHQRLIDSEILLIQSLKLRVYFFKNFHISVVEALNNLAGIYQIQGY